MLNTRVRCRRRRRGRSISAVALPRGRSHDLAPQGVHSQREIEPQQQGDILEHGGPPKGGTQADNASVGVAHRRGGGGQLEIRLCRRSWCRTASPGRQIMPWNCSKPSL